MLVESGILKKSNKVLFDSRNRLFKNPFGAVSTKEFVKITFPVDCDLNADGVSIIVRRNDSIHRFSLEKKCVDELGYDIFEGNVLIDKPGVYYYRFEIYSGYNTYFCGQDGYGRAILGDWLPEWQLSVYEASYKTADFIKGGVVYHIFVDRFNRSGELKKPEIGVAKNWDEDVTIVDSDGVYRANDFFGGNFKGIEEKLPYLKELGVTCLYLSPIFLSHSNHRYDTADYLELDPLLGNEDDFKSLIDKAKKSGISIVLDGVFNHTGADSKYFNKFGNFDTVGAYQSKNSPYYDWYTFSNYPNEYMCWWGVTVCPTIARDATGFRNLIAGKDGVIEKWSKFGIAGWRLDVVDELSSSFVEQIRRAIKENNPDGLMLGEVWEDASVKISYGEERQYFYGEQLDGVMNYVYKVAILNVLRDKNVSNFVNEVYKIMENYPKDALNTCFTLLGSHDTVRAINELAFIDSYGWSKQQKKDYVLTKEEYEIAKKRLLLASSLQFFLPGVPSIYYGDEVGMQGFEDPLNRRTFPWGKEDLDILNHYKKLGQLRKKYKKDFIEYPFISCNDDGDIIIERAKTVFSCNVNTLEFSIIEKGRKK